jgi:membrane protein YqaA with SNARE-associated domain
MTLLTGLALFFLARYDQRGDDRALRAWLLALMCFYLTLCNSFLPLPSAWIILLAASPAYSLPSSGWWASLLVAGLATLATVVANLNEYHLLACLLQFGLGRRVGRTKLYRWAVRWFDRAPFQILTLIAFVPVPVDAVRWLAILRGYPRRRFALAYALGRGPRYLLLAGCSVLLALSAGQILMIQIAIVAAAVLGRLSWHWLPLPRPGTRRAEYTTVRDSATG